MPELPEIQIFKEYFDATSLDKDIAEVEVKSKEILQKITEDYLKAKLKDEEFLSSQRHGKYLFASVSGKFLIVFHFGMTGSLKYFKAQKDEPPHDRLLINFKNGYQLAFDDQRKFGRVTIAYTIDEFLAEKRLGKDALEINFHDFKEAIGKKSGTVKSALMDQHVIAGIGNIYSDEILFQTRINPKKKIDEIENKALKELHSNMRRILETAIKNHADLQSYPRNYLLYNRVRGAKCPNCGGKIATVKVAGRTAYFCPNCQK